MPYLTEQVWKYLPGSEGFIMLSAWPEYKAELDFAEDEKKMEGVMEIIRTVRNLRTEMNVEPRKRTRLLLLPGEGWADTLSAADAYFCRLAGASESEVIADASVINEKTVSSVTNAATIYIPLGDLVDFTKEIARLEKEAENVRKEIARASGKLNNPGFVAKAPAQLVEAEKAKLAANEAKVAAIEVRISELKDNA